MELRQMIKGLELDDTEVKTLESFLHHVAWDVKEVSSSNKLKHKELMRKVREYARTIFEDREIFIRSMDALISELIQKDFLLVDKKKSKDEGKEKSREKLKCQVDKIYDSTEMKVKLLKYLQGKGNGKSRGDIAVEFNISNNSLGRRIQELQSPDNNILGTKIQIKLERKTNLYESTVHPLFLALNLSEVYGMLTTLMKAEEYVPGETITNIIKDIISQLTDYTKEVLEETGLNIHDYANREHRSFRNESPKNRYFHAMKAGSVCRLLLYEQDVSILGKLKPNFDQGKEFIFHPQDGSTPIHLDCADIKDLIEIEEG